ncbi:hypothetical protein H2198_006761 [Neophaeococcomyces mojaviensis]|uniref:Uncharacterized protein n=1 Tax=Neophaeococcomyces mojaviensis TaxID=3383035 RepID=A0ACC3A1V8_9EURO|nr:hypothetical protein H2198_006761 [Knufia sp. JES_112]
MQLETSRSSSNVSNDNVEPGVTGQYSNDSTDSGEYPSPAQSLQCLEGLPNALSHCSISTQSTDERSILKSTNSGRAQKWGIGHTKIDIAYEATTHTRPMKEAKIESYYVSQTPARLPSISCDLDEDGMMTIDIPERLWQTFFTIQRIRQQSTKLSRLTLGEALAAASSVLVRRNTEENHSTFQAIRIQAIMELTRLSSKEWNTQLLISLCKRTREFLKYCHSLLALLIDKNLVNGEQCVLVDVLVQNDQVTVHIQDHEILRVVLFYDASRGLVNPCQIRFYEKDLAELKMENWMKQILLGDW